MNDIIVGRKLRNAIEKHIQGMEYHLHTINVNGDKRGCSGFIRNPNNNAIVYVNTEISTYVLRYMYRYADNLKDYTGYHNRFANTLIELSSNIAKLLEVPVNQTRDVRI